MDRSNIRESKSFEENEANMHTMKTIHSLDEMYKTYVPPTAAAKNEKPAPPSILKNPSTEKTKSPNCIRPVARNLAPFLCATPLQTYQICGPRVQFSCIPIVGGRRHHNVLTNPVRIASGQINRRSGNCSSFDSTLNGGSPSYAIQTNNVTFAEPQMYNESFYSQSPYYGDQNFSGYSTGFNYPGLPDQCQQPYPSDQRFDYQQTSVGPDSRECPTRYNIFNDNYFRYTSQEEIKSVCSSKSVCSQGDNQLISDNWAGLSSDGFGQAAANGLRLTSFCTAKKTPLTGLLNDTRPCPFNGASHQMDCRTCSPKPSCGSLKRKHLKVRIAGDTCSKSSSHGSLRSTCSGTSGCSDLKPSCSSDRGFIMPEPDCHMTCDEPENDCCDSGPSCCQPQLTCPPMICWNGCGNGCNTNQCDNNNNGCTNNSCVNNSCMDNCCMNTYCMNGCFLNDALQDCTVYRRDYKPVMTVCNHLYQHYGGCCWQDLPLGGGCGPCGGCSSCGGYGPLSNLPHCLPFPVDGNRYIPPSATMDTCSRPFCDHYAEDPNTCNSGMQGGPPCAGNSSLLGSCSLEGSNTPCCETMDCMPQPTTCGSICIPPPCGSICIPPPCDSICMPPPCGSI
ncbi:hypothetical protein KR200_011260 [Drosophila serrata]|nr:hypothetical protein KR200_011260 [Drosophila serrata]